MIVSKFGRYCAYLILGVIVILGVKELFTAVFLIKGDIANQAFMKDLEKQELKNKDDSIFNVDINSLIDLKRYDDAIRKLYSRIKSLPIDKNLSIEKTILLSQIGDIYQVKNDTNSAFRAYSDAIVVDESNANALGKRATINFYLHKLDDAIVDCKAAANINGGYYYMLGQLQAKKGDKKSAIASFDSCLNYYPKSEKFKLKIDSLKSHLWRLQ